MVTRLAGLNTLNNGQMQVRMWCLREVASWQQPTVLTVQIGWFLLGPLPAASRCVQLLHFHSGSQITSIREVKEVMREASFLHAELVKVGVAAGNVSP